MPTIIRPNRSGKPPLPASQPSTHLKELEKIVPIPEKSHIQPRSSSPYLTDLLDLDLSEDYSPPEPTIPPPAPPSFLLTSSPHVERERVDCSPSLELDVSDVPCAVALFDYQSSHSGDLNFKVFSIANPSVFLNLKLCISNESQRPRRHTAKKGTKSY